MRLGRTARLRDVDPSGRLGLVTRWVGSMRLFDLRRLRWVDEMVLLARWRADRAQPDLERPRKTQLPAPRLRGNNLLERLSPTGDVYCTRFRSSVDDAGSFFETLEKRSLVTGVWKDIETSQQPVASAGMTKDGHYYYVSAEQLVVVIAPDDTVRTFEPLPRRVVQACHVNMETKLLASAGWGEIALHAIEADALEHIDGVRTTGNCSWLRLEAPWLAACVDGVLRIWYVSENLHVGDERFQHTVGDMVRAADISRDGRYLAFAANRKVILHDLEQDLIVEYDDHSDEICLVRFVGLDQMLVTADEDNRVVMRPRTPAGYVRTLIEIAIPDAPVELALDDEIQGR
ncbi:MAG: hypothetical protein ACKV2T_29180 [Kofleriaceae bacterium]